MALDDACDGRGGWGGVLGWLWMMYALFARCGMRPWSCSLVGSWVSIYIDSHIWGGLVGRFSWPAFMLCFALFGRCCGGCRRAMGPTTGAAMGVSPAFWLPWLLLIHLAFAGCCGFYFCVMERRWADWRLYSTAFGCPCAHIIGERIRLLPVPPLSCTYSNREKAPQCLRCVRKRWIGSREKRVQL